MPINSRAKGKRGELEAVHYLRSLGFEGARRSQQYQGGMDSSDVIIPELPNLHVEVKFGYPIGKFDVCTQLFRDACEQSKRDAKTSQAWVVLWKPKGYRTWRLSFFDPYLGVVVTTTTITDKLLHKVQEHLT